MRKVCRNCKLFITEELCPICKRDIFSNSWNGRIFFLDYKKSIIAEKMGITKDGEYALKVK